MTIIYALAGMVVFAFIVCCYLVLRLQTVANERDEYLGSIETSKQEYEKAAANLTKNFNASHAHFMSQALVNHTAVSLRNNINASVHESYKKITQELLGDVTDQAEALSRDLSFALIEKIWDSFQQLKEAQDDTPQLLPRNAKIAFTKGNRTVVVIENEPQVRSISLSPDLLSESEVTQAAGSGNTGYRFNLAFPYVLFVIVFDEGRYYYHSVYYRNTTLTSAREYIYLAPLPNVNRETGSMCMGRDFPDEMQEQNTLPRQCEFVVCDFWQRTFNNHYGNGGIEKVDKRLASFAAWQKNSEIDPLFILSVKWKNGKTLKGVLESILDRRDHDTKLDGIDRQVKEILDSGVRTITNVVSTQCNKDRIKDLNPAFVEGQSRDMLESLLTAHISKVFEHCTKG